MFLQTDMEKRYNVDIMMGHGYELYGLKREEVKEDMFECIFVVTKEMEKRWIEKFSKRWGYWMELMRNCLVKNKKRMGTFNSVLNVFVWVTRRRETFLDEINVEKCIE